MSMCQCDNTHESVDSVCLWCWSKGRRKWNDPEIGANKVATIDDVMRFLVRHKIRSVEIDFDKDEALVTEQFGSTQRWIDLSVQLQEE